MPPTTRTESGRAARAELVARAATALEAIAADLDEGEDAFGDWSDLLDAFDALPTTQTFTGGPAAPTT